MRLGYYVQCILDLRLGAMAKFEHKIMLKGQREGLAKQSLKASTKVTSLQFAARLRRSEH